MLPLHRHISLPLVVAVLMAVTPLRGEDVSVDQMFATVPFDQWVKQGRVKAAPWKVIPRDANFFTFSATLRTDDR